MATQTIQKTTFASLERVYSEQYERAKGDIAHAVSFLEVLTQSISTLSKYALSQLSYTEQIQTQINKFDRLDMEMLSLGKNLQEVNEQDINQTRLHQYQENVKQLREKINQIKTRFEELNCVFSVYQTASPQSQHYSVFTSFPPSGSSATVALSELTGIDLKGASSSNASSSSSSSSSTMSSGT